jgi:hypothetical protein
LEYDVESFLRGILMLANLLNFLFSGAVDIHLYELNPFIELKETNVYPYARSLRTTFFQKLMDTFWVFLGNPIQVVPRDQSMFIRFFHFGIVDYATLGITYIIQRFTASFLNHYNESELWIGILLGVLQLPITFARTVSASVLTILSIPFVAIAHLITYVLSSEYKKHINEYEISNPGQSTTTIFAMLKTYGCQLEDITDIDYRKEIENGILKIQYKTNYSGFCEYMMMPIDSSGQLYRPNDIKFFQALQRLNIGGIQEKIEEDGGPFATTAFAPAYIP